MTKALPVAAILGCLLAALFVGNLTLTEAPIPAVLAAGFLVVAAVAIMLERGRPNLLAGIGVLVLAIVPLLLMTPVTGEGDKTLVPDFSVLAAKLIPILLVLPVAWLVYRRGNQLRPEWLAYAAYGFVGLLAIVSLLVENHGDLGPLTFTGAVFALLLLWPPIALLRSPRPEASAPAAPAAPARPVADKAKARK